MTIELTETQRQAIAECPMTLPRVVAPGTNTTYVLVRADVFDRLQGVLDGDVQPRDAYSAIDQAFAEGWNDPKMDDYDRYEELKR
jgi:hypothetical protein